MDQTVEHIPSFDPRSGDPPSLRCSLTGGYAQAQPSIWSLLYVVSDVSLQHSLEVPTIVDEDAVKALLANGPHEPLRECVRSRCADRRWDDAEALGAKHLIEGSRELGVAVTKEEPNARKPLVDGKVPGLLGDPRLVGVRGDA